MQVTKILPLKTQSLIHKLNQVSDLSWLEPFYLSGGTGLALHLNHRQSQDLDFFIPNPFILNLY